MAPNRHIITTVQFILKTEANNSVLAWTNFQNKILRARKKILAYRVERGSFHPWRRHNGVLARRSRMRTMLRSRCESGEMSLQWHISAFRLTHRCSYEPTNARHFFPLSSPRYIELGICILSHAHSPTPALWYAHTMPAHNTLPTAHTPLQVDITKIFTCQKKFNSHQVGMLAANKQGWTILTPTLIIISIHKLTQKELHVLELISRQECKQSIWRRQPTFAVPDEGRTLGLVEALAGEGRRKAAKIRILE